MKAKERGIAETTRQANAARGRAMWTGKASPLRGTRLADSTREKMSLAKKGVMSHMAREYVLVSPDGTETDILSLTRFCRENEDFCKANGLSRTGLKNIACGLASRTKTGWTIRKA